MRMFSPNVTRGSPLRNFYNDLKAVMQVGAAESRDTFLGCPLVRSITSAFFLLFWLRIPSGFLVVFGEA